MSNNMNELSNATSKPSAHFNIADIPKTLT